MRPRSPIAAILPLGAALLFGCARASVQTQATVTGTPADRFVGAWHLDSTKSSSVGGGTGSGRGGGGGTGGGIGMGPTPDVLVIRQGAGNLTIDQIHGSTNSRLTFALDGRKVTNTIGSGPAARQGVYVSAWSGTHLVTTITAPAAKGSKDTVTYQDVRYIDDNGSLVVEISMQGRPNSRRVVYTKSK